MGAVIAKQPNGLYCRFSTIVDTFTHINMTEEDYVNYCKEVAEREAREDLKNLAKRMRPFEEVILHFMPHNQTVEDFKEDLKSMGYDKEFIYDGDINEDDG